MKQAAIIAEPEARTDVARSVMTLDGATKLIAHIGYPTSSFKAPMIYNPWFESLGLNAAVVPLGVTAEISTLPSRRSRASPTSTAHSSRCRTR